MRFSSSSLIAASTAVAALLLAACTSHGVVPATSSFGPSSISPEALSPDAKKPTPKPCAKPQVPWDFGGSCGTVAIKAGGGTASMAAYNGFTIKATFPKASPAPGAGELLVVRDATNTKKDITGVVKGMAFPPFNKAGGSTSPFTVKPILYMKAHNQGGAFAFTGTPLLTVTSVKPFPGKYCILTKMIPSNNTWQGEPVIQGKITGHTVVFPSKVSQTIIGKNGTIYLAMACYTSV
jgi:hypothetical protein